VPGLAQGAFAVLEDSRPQTIRFFTIGYVSTNTGPDGTFRLIRVIVD
jgi:hypothetical protein